MSDVASLNLEALKAAVKRIPFTVAALAQEFEAGSYKKAIAEAVAESVRRDVELYFERLACP